MSASVGRFLQNISLGQFISIRLLAVDITSTDLAVTFYSDTAVWMQRVPSLSGNSRRGPALTAARMCAAIPRSYICRAMRSRLIAQKTNRLGAIAVATTSQQLAFADE
jgi:hypothetical protein